MDQIQTNLALDLTLVSGRGTDRARIDRQTCDQLSGQSYSGELSLEGSFGLGVSGNTKPNMPRNKTARSGKRPLRSFSEKMEAIKRVHDGESKAAVARDIGVPESTLRGWCKSEHKIRSQANNLGSFGQVSSLSTSDRSTPSVASGSNLPVAITQRDSTNEDPVRKRLRVENETGTPPTLGETTSTPSTSGVANGPLTDSLEQMSLRMQIYAYILRKQQEQQQQSGQTNDPSLASLEQSETGHAASANTGETEPDLQTVINYMEMTTNWLEQHGSALCTFTQLSQMKKVLENMKEYLAHKDQMNVRVSDGSRQ